MCVCGQNCTRALNCVCIAYDAAVTKTWCGKWRTSLDITLTLIFRIKNMAAVGFEPTSFRTGA